MKILNLRKIYGKQIILNNISVEASKGQIIGLVGNNGSGKTTLLKCISNLIVDYQGEIELDGKLAFSIESPTFYDDLTVFTNLKLFSELAGSKKVNIEEVLNQVKLKDAKNKKFKQLSLGMKQKLSIARILLDNADIILLDEPFNGLDILTKEQLKELMIMLRSKGKLLIVSSHILEELGEISEREISKVLLISMMIIEFIKSWFLKILLYERCFKKIIMHVGVLIETKILFLKLKY